MVFRSPIEKGQVDTSPVAIRREVVIGVNVTIAWIVVTYDEHAVVNAFLVLVDEGEYVGGRGDLAQFGLSFGVLAVRRVEAKRIEV